jgi:hypothetical protein
MKTNDEPERPGVNGSADGAAAPDSDGSPDSRKEQELDELRRFRVRTVPPEVRRQWLLAETPIVSSVELSDTVPPERVDAADRSNETPSDIRSLRAKTRKLERVEPKIRARPEPSQRLVLVSTATVIGVVLFVIVYLVSGRRTARVDGPSESVVPAQIEPATTAIEKPTEIPAAVSPPKDAPREEPAAAVTGRPSTAPQKVDRAKPKDPASPPPSSRRLPPVASPPNGTDIKTPLFGK